MPSAARFAALGLVLFGLPWASAAPYPDLLAHPTEVGERDTTCEMVTAYALEPGTAPAGEFVGQPTNIIHNQAAMDVCAAVLVHVLPEPVILGSRLNATVWYRCTQTSLSEGVGTHVILMPGRRDVASWVAGEADVPYPCDSEPQSVVVSMPVNEEEAGTVLPAGTEVQLHVYAYVQDSAPGERILRFLTGPSTPTGLSSLGEIQAEEAPATTSPPPPAEAPGFTVPLTALAIGALAVRRSRRNLG